MAGEQSAPARTVARGWTATCCWAACCAAVPCSGPLSSEWRAAGRGAHCACSRSEPACRGWLRWGREAVLLLGRPGRPACLHILLVAGKALLRSGAGASHVREPQAFVTVGHFVEKHAAGRGEHHLQGRGREEVRRRLSRLQVTDGRQYGLRGEETVVSPAAEGVWTAVTWGCTSVAAQNGSSCLHAGAQQPPQIFI